MALALDEAVSAGLLVESGRSWAGSHAFPHQLMRESLAADVGGLRLRRLHLRGRPGAQARPRLGGGSSAAVATHLRAAGAAADPAEAAEWSRRAAREASALYAWDEAIEYADAAVSVLEDTDTDHAVRPRRRSRPRCCDSSRVGDFTEAVDLLETALRATSPPVTTALPAWSTAVSAGRCACTTP